MNKTGPIETRKPSTQINYRYLNPQNSKPWAVERGREQRIRERMREAVQVKIRIKLPWAVERGSQQQWRESEKEWERQSREEEAEGTIKILGIWVILFVLICDCFMVNLLDRICSLSCLFLVCLEDNNVIFG